MRRIKTPGDSLLGILARASFIAFKATKGLLESRTIFYAFLLCCYVDALILLTKGKTQTALLFLLVGMVGSIDDKLCQILKKTKE